MTRNRKSERGKSGMMIGFIINITLGFFNIAMGIYNLAKSDKEIKLLDYDITKSNIAIVKEFPMFEIQYFDIDELAFEELKAYKRITDSLSAETLRNYLFVENDINNLKEVGFDTNRIAINQNSIIALAIRQIGGSIAKDVTVEYDYLQSSSGLHYFTTTTEEIMSLEQNEKDISGKTIFKQKYTIGYGDIPVGRGLIIPLFVTYDVRDPNATQDLNKDELWSITSPGVLIPIKISFKNIYNNKTNIIEIRKMNKSAITYSLYIEGRG